MVNIVVLNEGYNFHFYGFLFLVGAIYQPIHALDTFLQFFCDFLSPNDKNFLFWKESGGQEVGGH